MQYTFGWKFTYTNHHGRECHGSNKLLMIYLICFDLSFLASLIERKTSFFAYVYNFVGFLKTTTKK